MKHQSFTTMLAFVGAMILSSCATLANQTSGNGIARTDWAVKSVQQGKASWYGIRCNGGTHTASGERLNNEASTAAHKTLPLGTKVRVTNLSNGKSEIVRITDRGPYTRGRIIDVTEGVAKRLGFYSRGIVSVKVEVLSKMTGSGN
ncbi:rare lipoprotein A [Haloferula luteola]|uniref:Probable endolytic peptidoglycan transglycosylase RlpA n=1 Tax=Haloferula luteola TaxID=595692 RepID=A0A840V3L3_9BACT|nr:septal ring lytic transglycosylase RlpA family protein [Haloferula luteola]MBB5352572.1 rare lipoprotein A [Haloferula luteola]